MSIKKYTIIDILICSLLCFFFFVLPIIYFPKLDDPFDFPKSLALYFINSIVILLWLCRAFLFGFRIFLTKIEFALLFLLIANILATVFAISKETSFWGNYLRYDGLVTWINYLLLFFLVFNFMRNKIWIERAFICITLGSFLSASYGIWQYLSGGPELWQDVEKSRIHSTLGNPVFFTAYMASSIFFAFYLFFKRRIFLIITLAIFLGLLFGQTRASTLGFAIALLTLVFIQIRFLLSSFLKSFSLFFMIFSISLFLQLHPQIQIFKRFSFIFERKIPQQIQTIESKEGKSALAGSAEHRTRLWREFFEVIKDYPLFGVGCDNLIFVYATYRSQKSAGVLREAQYSRADRAHNDLIDFTATRGIIGFVAYLCFLISYLVIFLRIYKRQKPEDKFGMSCCLCAALAYLIQNQFSLGTVPITCLFFISLALGLCFKNINKPQDFYKFLPKPKIYLFIVLFFLLLFIFYYWVVILRHAWGVYYYRIANICERSTHIPGYMDYAIVWCKRAIDKWKTQERFYESLIDMQLRRALDASGESKQYWATEAIKHAQLMTQKVPSCSIFWNLLGAGYEIAGDWKSAIDAFWKAHKCDKYFIDPINNIAMVYIKRGDYKKAKETLKYGLSILPDCPRFIHSLGFLYKSMDNLKKAEFYLNKAISFVNYEKQKDVAISLIEIYKAQKRYNNLIKLYQLIKKIDPKDYRTYTGLGEVYYELRRYSDAIMEYEKALKLSNYDIAIMRDLASICYQKGDYKKALYYFKKVLEKQPWDSYSLRLYEKCRGYVPL